MLIHPLLSSRGQFLGVATGGRSREFLRASPVHEWPLDGGRSSIGSVSAAKPLAPLRPTRGLGEVARTIVAAIRSYGPLRAANTFRPCSEQTEMVPTSAIAC